MTPRALTLSNAHGHDGDGARKVTLMDSHTTWTGSHTWVDLSNRRRYVERMSLRLTGAAAALLALGALVAGCGGDDAPATPAAINQTGGPGSTAPSPLPAATTPAAADVGGLVCKALAEILADNAISPFIPEAAVAQFGLKTLADDPTRVRELAESADAAAVAQCPADRTAVLGLAKRDSLRTILTTG